MTEEHQSNPKPVRREEPGAGSVDKFRREAGKVSNSFETFNPIVPEPEMPTNSLAKLYTSWSKNEIEWRVYKQQYSAMAEKQAELLRERANHIIAKAKVVHERELEQLREVLQMHNSEVISGLQQSSHDIAQDRLMEIANDYVKHVKRLADYPPEIREVLHQDATRVWDHARRKVLKYALEHTGTDEDASSSEG